MHHFILVAVPYRYPRPEALNDNDYNTPISAYIVLTVYAKSLITVFFALCAVTLKFVPIAVSNISVIGGLSSCVMWYLPLASI